MTDTDTDTKTTEVTVNTEVTEEPHPTSSPEAAYNFLIKKFHGKTDDGTVHLYRIGLFYSKGPIFEWLPVSYGQLLLLALEHLKNTGVGERDTVIDRVEVNSYGLTLWHRGQKLFVVEDAFVIGNEQIPGDHGECAETAYKIVEEICGKNTPQIEMILWVATTNVTLQRLDGSWYVRHHEFANWMERHLTGQE